jgi:hypothetical protein
MNKYLAIATAVLLVIAVGQLEYRDTSSFGPSVSLGPLEFKLR